MDNSSSAAALSTYINNYIATRGENDKIRNRTYGFANVMGGIWTINKRNGGDYIAPRVHSNTFQALRPYLRDTRVTTASSTTTKLSA